MTEKEKMLRGELYLACDPQLSSEHRRSLKLCREYNEMCIRDRLPKQSLTLCANILA